MKTMNIARAVSGLSLALLSLHCYAEVPVYDIKQPRRDGVSLVGVNCDVSRLKLELSIVHPLNPPPKNGTELWNMGHLVKFNPKTFDLEEVFKVERQCKLGSEHYRVVLEGLPGASNAMYLCGAGTGVHASVWLNEKLVFDEPLYRCKPPSSISRVVFGNED
jgi:hypothetical protein